MYHLTSCLKNSLLLFIRVYPDLRVYKVILVSLEKVWVLWGIFWQSFVHSFQNFPAHFMEFLSLYILYMWYFESGDKNFNLILMFRTIICFFLTSHFFNIMSRLQWLWMRILHIIIQNALFNPKPHCMHVYARDFIPMLSSRIREFWVSLNPANYFCSVCYSLTDS